jgi:hypothetical protein
MRYLIRAACCAAAVTLAFGPAHAQILLNPTLATYEQRPPPPIESSIPIVEKPAAAKPEPDAPKPAAAKTETPKPVVHHHAMRRPGKAPLGPVTVPPADAIVMMVRSTLAGVNQANFTENYSVLHEMTTPALQARVNAEQFGKAFANLRKQNLDLSPVLVLQPQFTLAPAVTPQGTLKLAGFFPSKPLQIAFAIDYRPLDGFWLVDSLSVSALPADASTPVASLAPPPPPLSSPPPASASASPRGSRHAKAPGKAGFEKRWAFAWPSHFIHATHFGPALSFAPDPD